MDLFVNADYDFLKIRRSAYIVSAALILVGIISLVMHGGPNYSIDFEGGLMMRISFEEPVDIGELRQVIAEATQRIPEVTRDIDEVGNYIIRIEELEAEVGMESAGQIQTFLAQAFQNTQLTMRSVEEVGPKVGAELRTKAIWAVLWAMLGILIYISWRFELRFAVISVLTLFHDVLLVLGLFSIMNIEISLVIVGALMTIVGYSLNDTIVVLDRIREDLKR